MWMHEAQKTWPSPQSRTWASVRGKRHTLQFTAMEKFLRLRTSPPRGWSMEEEEEGEQGPMGSRHLGRWLLVGEPTGEEKAEEA